MSTTEIGPDDLVFPAVKGGLSSLVVAPATAERVPAVMARMGHSSPRAALIYQHATAERDGAIADALDRMVAGLLAA